MKLRSDSAFARQFFGTPDAPRTLNINEFRNLLNGLNERLIRQDFESHDLEGNGMLSAQQFVEVLKNKGRGMVPQNVQENVYRYLSQRENSNISFEEYAGMSSIHPSIHIHRTN
jgi:Ca2+-binding EF-hand superfamily protein